VKRRVMIWIFVYLPLFVAACSAVAAVAGYVYMRSEVNSYSESALAAASAAETGAVPGVAAPGATPIALTPSCAKAVACCKATMAKTAGANAAAGEQACNGIGLLSDDVCAKQYEGQKRAATVVGALCP